LHKIGLCSSAWRLGAVAVPTIFNAGERAIVHVGGDSRLAANMKHFFRLFLSFHLGRRGDKILIYIERRVGGRRRYQKEFKTEEEHEK
jgi:hypothetical protein